MTEKKLYEIYCTEVQKGKTLSKSFFVYTILAVKKIHHSERSKFCLLCELYDAENIFTELTHHKQLIPLQKGQYTKEKQEIVSEKPLTTALMTQNFTQITFKEGFVQDLIICIYFYNKKEKDGLQRTYRHFVGSTTDKNDIFL